MDRCNDCDGEGWHVDAHTNHEYRCVTCNGTGFVEPPEASDDEEGTG